MAEIVRERVLTPRMPWRTVSFALIVIALLLAAALVMSGALRTPRPAPPYGPAANGLVAFDSGGDIYTVNPSTGEARPIITGPEEDSAPRFSLDGTRIAFQREVEKQGRRQLYVADADGSDLTLITPEPLFLQGIGLGREWEQYSFSPDGESVLIAAQVGAMPTIAVAAVDGSGVRQFDIGMRAKELSFRPPDGGEVLFVSMGFEDERGIYALDTATGEVRNLVRVDGLHEAAGASWSPDGSRVAYWIWDRTAEGITARTHVVDADGANDHSLPLAPGAVFHALSAWSNDGTRLFVAEGFTSDLTDVHGYVLPADASSPGYEVSPTDSVSIECCSAWEWSPDDAMLIGTLLEAGGKPVRQALIDVAARAVRQPLWAAKGYASWQRVAP